MIFSGEKQIVTFLTAYKSVKRNVTKRYNSRKTIGAKGVGRLFISKYK